MSSSPESAPRPGPTDQRIEAARAGGKALAGLLEDFRAYLLLVAGRRLADDVRAKVGASDLVQETLVRAHRHFGRFRGHTEAELRAWLLRILRNHLANAVAQYRGTGKRDLAREVPFALAPLGELAGAVADEAESPRTVLMARERAAALERALGRLPEHYRRVIAWRNQDRLPFPEIGRRLGCSAEAARKLWARAVDRLGQALEAADDTPG